MMSRFFRRLSAWAGLLVLAAMLSSASAPQCSYLTTVRATAATPYLPFNLVETHGPRKVFADYMPSLPISIDNKDGVVRTVLAGTTPATDSVCGGVGIRLR